MKKTTSFLLVLIAASCTTAWTLSPPQYGLWREIKGSFGASPNVQVKEIYEENGVNIIDIVGSDADVCNGLAYVMTLSYNFGGIKVTVRILDKGGNQYTAPILKEGENAAEVLKKHFQNALQGNPYFSRVLDISSGFVGVYVWIEFQPKVIQFWNDNIGDYYGNNNYVAADVFSGVCRSDFGSVSVGTLISEALVSAGYTTAPVVKESQAGFYRQFK